jgi:meromycolic acid enoyl-[acyl-carrier-protein] reductase
VLLADRRILVTGVLTEASIAFAVAAAAQQAGADVVLGAEPRRFRVVSRTARQLPEPADVLALDVTDAAQVAAVASTLDRRWGRLDGLVHSVAYAPPAALGGGFLECGSAEVGLTLAVSALSLRVLCRGLASLLGRAPRGGSVVGFDFGTGLVWPGYDWQGVAKATLGAVSRYLALYVGARQIRVNLIAAGPLGTPAGRAVGDFDATAASWARMAPLGWNAKDATPVADTAVFLLSHFARGITGETVHVDGGVHMVGDTGIRAAAP